jgi:SAM-dependent methyltransferase
MASSVPPLPAQHAMTGASQQRWDELLRNLAGLLPAGSAYVLIDGEGDGEQPAILAGRLAAALNADGRSCFRLTGGFAARDADPAGTIKLGDGSRRGLARHWDVVIWLRSTARGREDSEDSENRADIVVDLHDPSWPVIRRVAPSLAGHYLWYVAETRAFFSPRAATWDTRFGDDMPAYAAAVAQARIPQSGVVVDVGCGTGRALPALREAVGPRGTVIAVDLTPEMLREASLRSGAAHAAVLLADARYLPLADASVDAVFAAGLVMHLPDIEAGFGQLARITRPGGLLILFHPTGRAVLAARHGRTLGPDEPLAVTSLRRITRHAGWQLTAYDDAADHFLAIATRG